MYGHSCENQQHVQEMRCTTSEGEFKCIKTKGDVCVTTGTLTLRGNLPERLEPNKDIPVVYTLGNKAEPNSRHLNNNVKIVRPNEFVSGPRRYVRKNTRPNPYSQSGKFAPRIYFNLNYFEGRWLATGYTCNPAAPKIEVVDITFNEGMITGKKIVGDECVPEGKDTFRFRLPPSLWPGLYIPISFWIGKPTQPAHKVIFDAIKMIDVNHFQIGHRNFYRDMTNQTLKSSTYIDMRGVVGKGYSGPGVIKINPKANLRIPVRRFVIVEEDTARAANC